MRSRLTAILVSFIILTIASDAFAAGLRVQDPDGDGVREIIVNPHTVRPRLTPKKIKATAMEGAGELDPKNPNLPTDANDPTVSSSTLFSGGGTLGTVRVVGIAINYGGGADAPPVLTKLDVRIGAGSPQAVFADVPYLYESDTDPISLGSNMAQVVFTAKAAYPDFTNPTFSRTVDSNSSSAIVLVDGNNLTAILNQKCAAMGQANGCISAFDDQQSIEFFLDPYLDENGNVDLLPNQVLILNELGTTNPASDAYDFQDLVVLCDIVPGLAQAGDTLIEAPLLTEGPFDTDFTSLSSFGWSLIRFAPGNTRKGAVAFSRNYFSSTLDEERIYTCFMQNNSWSSCQTDIANVKLASVRNLPDGLDPSVPGMAITNNGRHILAWTEQDQQSSPIRRRYVGTISGDDGATWSSVQEIGHFTPPSSDFNLSPNDIDVAVNDKNYIGVLAYYRQTASPAPAPNPTETGTLMLNLYDTSSPIASLASPTFEVTIVPGTEAIGFANNCSTHCYDLVGDKVMDLPDGHWKTYFHVFYNHTSKLRVATVEVTDLNAVTLHSPPRIVSDSQSVNFVVASRTWNGARFAHPINLTMLEIPTSPLNQVISVGSFSAGQGIGSSDNPYSNSLRGSEPNEIIEFGSKYIQTQYFRENGTAVPGMETANDLVLDIFTPPFNSPLSYCMDLDPSWTYSCTGSTRCYEFNPVMDSTAGAVKPGFTYYMPSFLTYSECDGAFFDAFHQYVVIHAQHSEAF